MVTWDGITEEQLIEKAAVAYRSWCKSRGVIFQQPCVARSYVSTTDPDPVLLLRNASGETFARYHFFGGKLSKLWVEETEAEWPLLSEAANV